MPKKKAAAKSKATPKREPASESATKADLRILSARLDVLERDLKELWKRTAPDTELD